LYSGYKALNDVCAYIALGLQTAYAYYNCALVLTANRSFQSIKRFNI